MILGPSRLDSGFFGDELELLVQLAIFTVTKSQAEYSQVEKNTRLIVPEVRSKGTATVSVKCVPEPVILEMLTLRDTIC